MARNIKWIVKQSSTIGNVFRADVYDNGDVASSVYTFTGGSVMAEWCDDDSEDITACVRALTGYLRVIVRTSEDKSAFEEMMTNDPFGRKIVITNETENKVVFVGYLSTEAYNQDLCEYIKEMEVPIKSPLALLECEQTSISENDNGLELLESLVSLNDYDEIYVCKNTGIQSTPQFEDVVIPSGVIYTKDYNDITTYVRRSTYDVICDILKAYGYYITERSNTLYILPYFGNFGYNKYTKTTTGGERPITSWTRTTVSEKSSLSILSAFTIEGTGHKVSVMKGAKSLLVKEELISEGSSDIKMEDESSWTSITGSYAGDTVSNVVYQAEQVNSKQKNYTFYKRNPSGQTTTGQIWPKTSSHETYSGATSALNTKFNTSDKNANTWNHCILMCGGANDSSATGLSPAMKIKYPIKMNYAKWLFISGKISESDKVVVHDDTKKFTGPLYATIRVGDKYYNQYRTTDKTDVWDSNANKVQIAGLNSSVISGGNPCGDNTQKMNMKWSVGFWCNMPYFTDTREIEITIYAPKCMNPANWLIIEDLTVGLRNNESAKPYGSKKARERKSRDTFSNKYDDDVEISINLYSEIHNDEVITNYCNFHGYNALKNFIKNQFSKNKTKLELEDTRETSSDILTVYTHDGKTYRNYSNGFNTNNETGKQMFIELIS